MREVLLVLQGLLTPVIAIIAVYIAWQQWKANKMNDDDPKWIAICKRDQAFAAARADLLEGTLTIVDVRLTNCLKYFGPTDLSEMCLEKLLVAYGQ